MIDKLLIIDLNTSDEFKELISNIKNVETEVLYYDYNVDLNNLFLEIAKIQNDDNTEINIKKLSFLNVVPTNNNVFDNTFKSNVIDYNDIVSSTNTYFNFISEIVNLFPIENIEFININNLIKPYYYVHIYDNLKTKLPEVNISYISQSDILDKNDYNNFLNYLYNSYESNITNIINNYFTINDNTRSLVENYVDNTNYLTELNYDINTRNINGEFNLLLIPLISFHDNDNKLYELLEKIISSNYAMPLFIYNNDNLIDIYRKIDNISSYYSHINNINVCIYYCKNSILSEKKVSNNLNLVDINESNNFVYNILNKLSSLSSSISINICNLEKYYSIYFDSIINYINDSSYNVLYVNDELKKRQNYIYLPEDNIPNLDFEENNYSIKNLTYKKDNICEKNISKFHFLNNYFNSIEDILNDIVIENLILYDNIQNEFLNDVYMSLMYNTEIMVIDSSNDTYDIIQDKISTISNYENVILENVSLFQKYKKSDKYSFLNEEESHLQNVGGKDSLPEHVTSIDELLVDVSKIPELIEENEKLDQENINIINSHEDAFYDDSGNLVEYDDSYNLVLVNEPLSHGWWEHPTRLEPYIFTDLSLNTWVKFKNFIKFLKDLNVKNVDLLMCSLSSKDWKYVLNKITNDVDIMIRSSEDDTGHVMFGGDWILENPNNTDLVDLYFNKNIYDVKIVLGTGYVFTNSTISSGLYHLVTEAWGPDYGINTYGTLDTFNTSGVTSFHRLFINRTETNKNYIHDLNSWDTGNVTTMQEMFNNSTYVQFKISNWNVSNVKNMSSVFRNLKYFKEDLSSWDVGNVTTMDNMFHQCRAFNCDISNWNVGNVTNFSYTFYYTFSLKANLDNWDVTGRVISMSGMFHTAWGYNGTIFKGNWKNIDPNNNVTSMFTNIGGHIETNIDLTSGFQTRSQLKTAVDAYINNKTLAYKTYGKIGDWNVSNVTDMSELFRLKQDFNEDITGWNVGNVTNMYRMFSQCNKFNQDINHWDVSKVTNMSYMFHYSGITYDLDQWDTGNVTDMSYMFHYTYYFNNNIDTWNVSNVTNMSGMFANNLSFNSSIDSWDVGNVTNMSYMFSICLMYNKSLDSWIMSNRNVNVSYMFQQVNFYIDDGDYKKEFLGDWMNLATSSYTVTGMNTMFQSSSASISTDGVDRNFVPQYGLTPEPGYEYFTSQPSLRTAISLWHSNRDTAQTRYGHISEWDVANVTNFHRLFWNMHTQKIEEDLSNWDTGNVTVMSEMFMTAYKINPNISGWDTSKVVNMQSAFQDARQFNGDISGWDVGNVTNMDYMFKNAWSFNSHLTNWNVSNVKNMGAMFMGAYSFDGNVSNWDVSGVTKMGSMFYYAYSFNQDITNWKPISTTNLSIFLMRNYSFDQDLSSWNDYIGNVTDFNQFFRETPACIAIINWPNMLPTANITNMFYDSGARFPFSGSFQTKTELQTAIKNYNLTPLVYKDIYGDINTWDVTAITDMSQLFSGGGRMHWFNEYINDWVVDNVTNMNYMFNYTHQFDQPLDKWNVSNVKNMSYMFYNNFTFNQNINSWNVSNVTNMSYMFVNNYVFNHDLSSWAVSERIINFDSTFKNAYHFNVVLGGFWTIIDENCNVNNMFTGSQASISSIPYNAPRITIDASGVTDNGSISDPAGYIDMTLDLTVVNNDITSADINATNGVVSRFYQVGGTGSLEYSFRVTAVSSGSVVVSILDGVNVTASEWIINTFTWSWSPPVSQISFYTTDVAHNSSTQDSTIYFQIQLTEELINSQNIPLTDISYTNGVISNYLKNSSTNYSFTFVSSLPNIASSVFFPDYVDVSSANLPPAFNWTWSVNIPQPELYFTSVDVSDGNTIKKNEINVVLNYTLNNNISLPTLTVNDLHLTNCIITNFVKSSRTTYTFKMKSILRSVETSVEILENQFKYIYVDGNSNLEVDYDGLNNKFSWYYNGLDISPVNNKKIGVVLGDSTTREVDISINGNVAYNPIYNEYVFDGNISNYLSITGEIFTGEDSAAVSFWYKTNSTADWSTIITIRDNLFGNPNQSNMTVANNNNNKLSIKKSGFNQLNNVTSSVSYGNSNYTYIVISFNLTSTKVFKDGVLVETINNVNVINGGERPNQFIGIGFGDTAGIDYGFDGSVKNIRFFNKEVSDDQALSLYNMYDTGMNDTVPQIETITLYSTDVSNVTVVSDASVNLSVVNMVMDLTYDTTSSVSSIDTQSFVIQENNFDVSLGYIYDFVQVNNNRVTFKFGASTTIDTCKISVLQDSITRNINNNLNVVSNPTSNIFEWKYSSPPLKITSIKSNLGDSGMYTNADVIWVQVVFSEVVYNFRKKYIKGTNCKIIKVTGSGTKYAVKLKTFFDTQATIDIDTNIIITTGRGLQKYIDNTSVLTYSWNYDNIAPILSVVPSHNNNVTNNLTYLDLSINITKDVSDFTSSDIDIVGNASITSFTGSNTTYECRIEPLSNGNITVTFPTNIITDVYGNRNNTSTVFNWYYDGLLPNIEIYSTDITSSSTNPVSDVESINVTFLSNKELVNFKLSDITTENGNLSNLVETTTYPGHVNNYTVTVGSRTSNNDYYNSSGSNSYYLNGVESPIITFLNNVTYTFDQSNVSNTGHQLRFYKDAEKTISYTTGVIYNGTAGSSGASTQIYIDSNTEFPLYYQCVSHEYMGNITTYGQAYAATLIPSASPATIDVQVGANTIKDNLNNFNDTSSNIFQWRYEGTDFLISLVSDDVTSGSNHLYDTIVIKINLNYTLSTLSQSSFTIVNGQIESLTKIDDNNYTLTFKSLNYNNVSEIQIAEGVINSDTGVANSESNKFIWTYSPPIPSVVITSTQINSGDLTNDTSIDVNFLFDENVTFLDSYVNLTSNATKTSLTGSGNNYNLTITPVDLDSSANIILTIDEGTFYNTFNGKDFENDVSYSFYWNHDGIIPVPTITTTAVTQDSSLTILTGQTVSFNVSFNKNIDNFIIKNIDSSNAILSSFSGSDSNYSFVLVASDPTIDNSINLIIQSGTITDSAGNVNQASNEFAFTLNAEVSRILETSAIKDLFSADEDIPQEEQLSTEDIDMLLAVEIPDFSVPDFEAVEEETGGEEEETTVDVSSVDVSYSVTVNNGLYYIDGNETPSLNLSANTTHRFNQDDSTNSGHPLLFYEDENKTTQYTTDVSINGTAGGSGAYTQITLTETTPTTLYYQCQNHSNMGGIITIGDAVEEVEEVVIPVISFPPAVKITNRKVFSRIIDQIFEKAEDVTTVKLSKDDVAVTDAAAEKLENVSEVIMAKSNQVDPPVEINDSGLDSAVFIPLANPLDQVSLDINGDIYNILVNSDGSFALSKNSAFIDNYNTNDVYTIDQKNSLVFGSTTQTTEQPILQPGITNFSSSVSNNGTVEVSDIVLTLSFVDGSGADVSVNFDLAQGETMSTFMNSLLSSSTKTGTAAGSVQAQSETSTNISNIVLNITTNYPDLSDSYNFTIPENITYYTTNVAGDICYNDVSYSFNWNYDATTYTSANEVQEEEPEEVFIDPNTIGQVSIVCFLKDTNILTTKGYKKVQDIIPHKDVLIDHNNNKTNCLELGKYVVKNNGSHYPYKIPKGSKLTDKLVCDKDLYLTHNHCIYLPHVNSYVPVNVMKNIKEEVRDDEEFVYYHVFTNNYFSDIIIANGLPCETHSKYVLEKIHSIDPTGELLKKVFSRVNMKVNGQRERLTHKEFNKLCKKYKKKSKKKCKK